MPEHFGNIFDSCTVCKRQGSERMSRGMCRKEFANTAYIGQLLQINIHLLITAHRQQYAERLTISVGGVSGQNLLRCIHNGNITHTPGFLSRLTNPMHTIYVYRNMFRPKLFHFRKCQSCQAAKPLTGECRLVCLAVFSTRPFPKNHVPPALCEIEFQDRRTFFSHI